MIMPHSPIDRLVDDLKPIRRVRPADALILVLAATATAVGIVAMQYDLRPDVMRGNPHPIVMIRSGMLLLLGFAALSAVITAARPGVGQTSNGWRWALAAAGLFPVTSAILSALNGGFPADVIASESGPWCLGIGTMGAMMIGGVLTLWLRRGAPTDPYRTGWLVGLAAGSFGTFAYSLHCPSDTVYYIGLWYSLAVGMCAALGRLIVPHLIRW